MLFAYSNRLGCLGSLGVSLLGSLVLIVLMLGFNGCLFRSSPAPTPVVEPAGE